MAENLLIVESPAKASTIKKYLGKNFEIKSSYGHIRDLSKKNFGVDIKNGFKPDYIIDPKKKKIITELKQAVKSAKVVWLASDEDREGEAIAWHLSKVLKLTEENSKRIIFNEITKSAVSAAIENPRSIDNNLVDAQQARRILDRLVGFELSELLWKKVKSSLSAGRVQSVAVRLVVEREREIFKFEPVASFKVVAIFIAEDKNGEKVTFKAELSKKFNNDKDAKQFIEACQTSDFIISKVQTKPSTKSPSAPFTTSTLQQEASRKLGYSVAQTMQVAQKLYEAGKISYMRTDSVSLSGEAIGKITKFVTTNFGDKYLKIRKYKTKAKSAQEAHEAIRPTSMVRQASKNRQEQKLYELVFNRTLASQMANALFDKTTITIDVSKREENFVAIGEVMKFDGFLRAYNYKDEDATVVKTVILPPLKEKQKLIPETITATEKFSHHPARYNEATLVKKLEELGIGRPSTYAPIISTIQKREYVIKESREGQKRKYKEIIIKDNKIRTTIKSENTGAENKKLFPTDIGMVVTDFLKENFDKIMDFNFTATVEKDFDKIADGKLVWQKMLENFYTDFHQTVVKTTETAERKSGERILGNDPETGKKIIVRIARYGPVVQLGQSDAKNSKTKSKDKNIKTKSDDKISKPKYASLNKDQHLETITLKEALELLKGDSNGKQLGEDPKTGEPVFVRIGKFGPIVQQGKYGGKTKPKFANLLKKQTIDTITIEEALKLLELPRTVGEFEGKTVVAGIGRFGPFVRHDAKFVSIKFKDDPISITIEKAIELIQLKRETEKKRHIKEFPNNPDIKIIKDRWGKPCVYYKRKYYRISVDVQPEKLTEKQALQIAGAK